MGPFMSFSVLDARKFWNHARPRLPFSQRTSQGNVASLEGVSLSRVGTVQHCPRTLSVHPIPWLSDTDQDCPVSEDRR